MLASEAVHAVPLGLVGEHGGGEGDVPLQHAGEALLLVLAGGAVVHRPRHVRRAVPGDISTRTVTSTSTVPLYILRHKTLLC